MTRDGQFTVELPNGTLIERLPVGLAAGEWWFTFVMTGFDPRRAPDPDFHRELRRSVEVMDADGGPLRYVGGAGGGSDSVQRQQLNFVDTGVRDVVISYRSDGVEHAREHVTLR